MMGGDGWMWEHGWGWGGWLLMVAAMALFWVALIVGVVLAIRFLSAVNRQPTHSPGYQLTGPEDVLADRFARGEIDPEEYRCGLALLRDR
ncbi:MAG: SHOCT domain-containing protein [Mycobacteriaceae bacterium]